MIKDDANIGEFLSKELNNFQLKELFSYLLKTEQVQLKVSSPEEGFELDGEYYCVEVLREDIPVPTFIPESEQVGDDSNDDIPPYPPPLVTL